MIQRYCEALGKSGCYFLSILNLAEKITGKLIDHARAYEECLGAAFIKADCFVNFPGRILEHYTGSMYEVSQAAKDYKPSTGEFEILRFERKDTTQTFAQFVVGDGTGRVAFDPYGDSLTVREGYLVSKRIFRRASI